MLGRDQHMHFGRVKPTYEHYTAIFKIEDICLYKLWFGVGKVKNPYVLIVNIYIQSFCIPL